MLQQLNSLHCIKPERLKGPLPFFDLNLRLQLVAASNTHQGLPIASVFPFTMLCLQWDTILLTGNQNMAFQQFIRSSIQKIQNEKFCTVECEDLQAQPTIVSGKRQDNMMLLLWFSASASREKQSVSEHGSKVIPCESSWNLWKDEMDQKSYSSFFSQRTKLPLLLYSTRFDPILLTHLHGHKICELYM